MTLKEKDRMITDDREFYEDEKDQDRGDDETMHTKRMRFE